ncbi:TrmH family RNA methyltransferase [Corynebacterium nuruki]|uniref:TrmH family RNA methyltransferase n=1 Tax=Corynebacterium nuruki TaxID=1032851 RepID=UPI000248565A
MTSASPSSPLAADWRTRMGDEPFTERTPRIVTAAKLHRAAARRKVGRFLAEGSNAVGSALRHGTVVEVYLTEDALDEFGRLLDGLTGESDRGTRVFLITDRAAAHISESVSTTGLFALCADQLVAADGLYTGEEVTTGCLAVPVETAEPGNAGALVRVADATGCDGVLFAGDSVDPQGGKAVRSSAGSLFHLPVARERSVPDVVDALHAHGYLVLATAGDGDISLDEATASVDGGKPLLTQKVAWLFGNEAHGLGDWQDLADLRVSIPMQGKAESFNLVTAAAVCLYETARVVRATAC